MGKRENAKVSYPSARFSPDVPKDTMDIASAALKPSENQNFTDEVVDLVSDSEEAAAEAAAPGANTNQGGNAVAANALAQEEQKQMLTAVDKPILNPLWSEYQILGGIRATHKTAPTSSTADDKVAKIRVVQN